MQYTEIEVDKIPDMFGVVTEQVSFTDNEIPVPVMPKKSFKEWVKSEKKNQVILSQKAEQDTLTQVLIQESQHITYIY